MSESRPRASSRLDALLFVLLVLLALVPRLYFVLEVHPPELYLKWDMANYDLRADRLREGLVNPWDAFTPAGYPAFLALIYSLAAKSYRAVAVAHAFLGACTAGITYLIARRLHGGRLVACVAGAAVAANAPLVVYAGFLLTETLFSFCVAALALLLVHAHDRRSRAAAVAAGILFAFGCAVRPNLIVAAPFLALITLHRRRLRWTISSAGLIAVPLLVAIGARTTLAAGRPALLATNGGINFFLARVRARGVELDPADPIVGVSGYHNRRHYTETVVTGHHAFDESYFYGAGLKALLDEPADAIRESASNVVDGLGLGPVGAWPEQGFWPGWMGHDTLMNTWARAAFYGGVLPAALFALSRFVPLGARKRRTARDARRILMALGGSVLITMLVFIGDPRVRVSFDPLFFALASEPLARVVALIRRRVAPPRPAVPRSA